MHNLNDLTIHMTSMLTSVHVSNFNNSSILPDIDSTITYAHFLDMSEDLEDYFTRLEVLYHPGGHGIPLRAAQKKFFNNFFLECKDICFSGMQSETNRG